MRLAGAKHFPLLESPGQLERWTIKLQRREICVEVRDSLNPAEIIF
jgi:hypothetical protein